MAIHAVGPLAPANQLAPATTHFFVDLLLGGGLLLVCASAALLAYLAWSRASKLSAEVWPRRGLRGGPILLPGNAQPLEDDREGDIGLDPMRPFVEVSIEQAGAVHKTKGGSIIRWSEQARSIKDRPFALCTESGDRVRVEPGGKVELVDRLEAAERIDHQHRRRVARIVPGEAIWVRGALSDERKRGDSGPYRGGGKGERWVLRPPPRGPMLVSSQPVEAEGFADARFHALFAGLFLALLLLCQGLLFRDYHALRSGGAPGEASVVGERRWSTRSKNGVHHHYAFMVRYETSTGWSETELETGPIAYDRLARGALVPVVYLPERPLIVQLGTPAELGIGANRVVLGVIPLFVLCLTYAIARIARRPWWRTRSLVETEPGTL